MKLASLTLLLLGAALAAQTPAPTPPQPQPQPSPPAATDAAERLRKLVQELNGLDDATWQQRLAQLAQQQQELERAAAQHRGEAKAHEQQAAQADAQAKAIAREREQLEALRKLVRANVEPAKAPAAAPPPTPMPMPMPKAEPAKSEPPKADAAKAEPAKAKPAEAAAMPAAAMPAAAMPKDAAKPASADAKKSDAKPPDNKKAEAAAVVTWAMVEPVFAQHCAGCHDPDSKKGGLDLTSFAAALQGGGSGKSIVPGQPEQSRLFRMVTQQERPFMPRDADPLPAAAIQQLQAWIAQGAVDDAAAARAFAQRMAAQAKAAEATVVDAAANGPPPLPTNVPALAVRHPSRAVPLASLAGSPRAPLLAVPGCEQLLLLDDHAQLLAVLPCAEPRLAALSFANDGVWLAVAAGAAGRSGGARVYDVRDGTLVGTVGKERDVPLAVAVHRGRGLIALGGSSKHARAFALGTGAPVIDGVHDDFVLGLAFSPDGALLAAADRAGNVVLWETDGGRIAQTLRVPKGAANAVAFHPSGRWLAVAAGDGTLRAFDLDGKERWQKPAHQGEAIAVAFGPGDRVASCGADGRVAVFGADGKAIATSPPCGDWLLGVAFAGDAVLAGDARGQLHRFDIASKQVTASAPLSPAQ